MAVLYRCFRLSDAFSNYRWNCKPPLSLSLCICLCVCVSMYLLSVVYFLIVNMFIWFVIPGAMCPWWTFSWHPNNWSSNPFLICILTCWYMYVFMFFMHVATVQFCIRHFAWRLLAWIWLTVSLILYFCVLINWKKHLSREC